MATITITKTLLDELRYHLLNTVSYARYKIKSTWYRASIDTGSVRSNGTIHISFYIEAKDSVPSPATQFRLYDASGTMLVDRTETVEFTADLTRVLYQFRFEVIASGEGESS